MCEISINSVGKMDGRDLSLSNPQKMLILKRMKTRRARSRRNRRKTYRNVKLKQHGGLGALKQHGGLGALKQHGGLGALKQHGGLGQAYQIPSHAVVSAAFQEPDNAYPVLMQYGAYREAMETPIFGGEEETEKLNPSPENEQHRQENAEPSGRKEVQVEQAFSGVKGHSSSRRRRSANRSYS